MKAPKTMKLTPTNLYVLQTLFSQSDVIANALDATQVPHAKRLMALGLMKVGPHRTLELTEAGRIVMRGEA